jgi:hypothetical protein
MSEHDYGQQGPAEARRPMAPSQPSTDTAQRGGAPEGTAQGQSPMNPMPPQGWPGAYPGGPQAGMAGAGMPGPYPGHPGPAGYAGQPAYGALGMHPGVAPHPAAYPAPAGVDPYWAYHAQAQAAYAPPPYPYAGPFVSMAPPHAPWPGYGPGLEHQGGAGRMAGGGHGAGGPGMAELVDEIANGGNGLSSLSKILNVDDSEFWKGALLGAAAVLLLTNESVQGVLFKTGAKTKAAVKTGVDRVKERVQQASDPSTREAKDV